MSVNKTALDNIPADENVVLTEQLRRLFLYANCEPTCHCCRAVIAVGDTFKLAMVKDDWYTDLEPMDEMLCANCTVTMLFASRREQRRLDEEFRRSGYSRPHVGP